MSAICVTFTLLTVAPQYFSQNVGPLVKMTHGQVWPKPVLQKSYDAYLEFKQEHFDFKVSGQIYVNI